MALELEIEGAVQGVGFRPWAARAARELGLSGEVRNASFGVCVWLEGDPRAQRAWIEALRERSPAAGGLTALRVAERPGRGERGFRIGASASGPAGLPRIPLDRPLCEACRAELFDPESRRYRYAFTHCAGCGPRASVVFALPYDRERTALRPFALCAACRGEYGSPGDRRYHAQSAACPACGPQLQARALSPLAERAMRPDAIEWAAACLHAGGIVALKGYGGFHLLCDATDARAVQRLRERKRRPFKPFAVLVPDLGTARTLVELQAADVAWLAGDARAVVIAPARPEGVAALGLAPGVVPRGRELGLILPCAPAHALLFHAPGARPCRDPSRFAALVFTSANATDEPTLCDDGAAARWLQGLADLTVGHDRAVARPCDDSVVRSFPDGPLPVRLSRGVAPRVLRLPEPLGAVPPLLALGGDLKAAPAIAIGREVLFGEHVGDLGSAEAVDRLEASAGSLCALAGVKPAAVACDAHPDSLAAQLASRLGVRVIAVQHHHAHALACLAERGECGPALAWVLDGAGWGADGTLWGGELLRVEASGFERVAHLERAPLPGGDVAVREPWRLAALWLDRAFPEGAPPGPWLAGCDPRALAQLRALLRARLRVPVTSSCGRLFDAVASLLGLGVRATHEGELAMALESLAAGALDRELETGLGVTGGGGPACAAAERPWEVPAVDWVRGAVLARARGTSLEVVAARFHVQLARRLAETAARAARASGLRALVLSGGCAQNRALARSLRALLEGRGLELLEHRRVPPNDGGLALGQIVAAAAQLRARD